VAFSCKYTLAYIYMYVCVCVHFFHGLYVARAVVIDVDRFYSICANLWIIVKDFALIIL